MATDYPGSLDSFDTIASDKKTSDSVGGRTHRDMHNDLGDAIEAVQAELGTAPSGSYATVKARFEAIEGSTLPQIDAKGDLVVGTADNTYDNLAVGTDATVLVADSAQTKGVKWASITNANVDASAAIARSKISGLPTTSVDNTVVRFDSTGGAMQTSGVVIDDSNNISGVGTIVVAGLRLAYAAKTGAYTATTSDDVLNVTSGTFTLDLPATSTCAGKTLRVKNSGTGVVTLDGNSSETVEGVATFPLGAGSYVEFTSTGSAWILTGGVPDTGWRAITPNGTGWGSAGAIYIRRRGYTVEWAIDQLGTTGTAAAIDTALATTSGWRPKHYGFGGYRNLGTGVYGSLIYHGSDLKISVAPASGHTVIGSLVVTTNDPWPASLPGTAA